MNTIWKPMATGQVGHGRAALMMDAPSYYKQVEVVDANGKVLDTMSGPSQRGESGYKYSSNMPGSAYGAGSYVRFGNGDGKYGYISLKNGGSQGLGGDFDFNNMGNFGSTETAASLNPYSHGGGGGMAGGNFQPGQVGSGNSAAYYPGYLGGEFPNAQTINYKPTKTAPYQFTDPQAFASQFGDFNREQYQKNFTQSKGMATDTLDAELASLQHYIPAMGALQQSQASAENQFNQEQRTNQLNGTIPDVMAGLKGQTSRAAGYAQGRLPDGMDKGYELGMRSRSADNSTAGGFGATSSVARKASDLMSAEERFKIAQYGEGLTTQNASTRSALELAPPEYANTASQIRANPSVSPAQLLSSQLADINQYSMISPTNAMSSVVQQQQYATNLETANRQFNASNDMSAQQFNANVENQFATGKFNYDVAYAGTVAGAYQTNANTNLALEQQQQAKDQANATKNQAQNGNEAAAISGAVGSVAGALNRGGSSSGSSGGSGSSGNGSVATDEGGSINSNGSYTSPDRTVYDQGGNPIDSPEGSNGEVYGGAQGAAGATGAAGAPGSPGHDGSTSLPQGGGGGGSSGTMDVGAGMSMGDETGGMSVNPYSRSITPSQAYAAINAPAIKSFAQDVGVPAATAAMLAGATVTQPLKKSGTEADVKAAASAISGQDIANTYGNFSNGDANKHAAGLTGAADGVLANAGIFKTQQPGTVPFAINYEGKQLYADPKLVNNQDTTMGKQSLAPINKLVQQFGVPIDTKQWQKVQDNSNDPRLISALDNAAKNKDTQGFVNAALGATTGQSIKSLGNAANLKGTDTAYSAYQLSQNWGNMSGAQKSLAVATLGMQAYTDAGGKGITDAPIPMTQIAGRQPLTVGGGLTVAAAGFDVAAVAAGWGDMNDAHKILGGSGTAIDVVNTGVKTGLIDKGGSIAQNTNAAIPYVQGAAALYGAYNLYNNWGKMSNTGRAVGAAGVAGAGIGAASSMGYASAGLGVAGGVLGGAAATYQTTQSWGQGGAAGRAAGIGELASFTAAGAMIGGPVGAAVGFAVGCVAMAGSMIKTGKDEEQNVRDWFRSDWQSKNLVDANYKMTMADGSVADMGLDNHSSGDHKALDGASVGVTRDLRSYETDNSSDMDFTAGRAGQTLSRLMYGGRDKSVDQMGQQLGNAMLGKTGYGAQYNEDNFNNVMNNAKGVYAKMGITSKEAGFALVNQGLSEGRFSNADAVAMQQTLNMMYDKTGFKDSYQMQTSGRRADGIKTMQSMPDRPATIEPPHGVQQVPSSTASSTVNAPKASVSSIPIQQYKSVTTTNNVKRYSQNSALSLPKEDVRALNRQRYSQMAA